MAPIDRRDRGLTRRQADVMRYLRAQDEAGKTPSFEEIAERLGLKSKSGVYRLLTALEERGKIRRLPYRARAIELVERLCPHCGKPV